MVEAGTFTNNAEVLRKAGINASGASDTYTNHFIKEAQGEICGVVRQDWVTNYASLTTTGKEILRQAASNLAAIYLINYDMGEIARQSSRAEAEDRVNILRDNYLRVLGQLIDKKTQKFITG